MQCRYRSTLCQLRSYISLKKTVFIYVLNLQVQVCSLSKAPLVEHNLNFALTENISEAVCCKKKKKKCCLDISFFKHQQ